MDEIKKQCNIDKFNVLIADCEGFLETFFDENPCFYDHIRLIIFEADGRKKCSNVRDLKILEGVQNVWTKEILKS